MHLSNLSSLTDKTMNLAVIKNPDSSSLAKCRELGEATGPLLGGEELMTVEQLNAWQNEPEQVAKREEIGEANKRAALAAETAQDEAAISEFIAVWECTRAQALYELSWRKVLKQVKE